MNTTQDSAQQLLAAIGVRNVVGFFLVLARISPLFIVAPLFSSRSVPARARTIVALAFALGLYPLAVAGQTLPTELMAIIALLVKELLVGLAFALTVAIMFAAIEMAGSILDFMVGFAFGASLDPITGNNTAVLAKVYSLVAVTIFIVINGDAWLIQGLSRTFEIVPLTASPDFASIGEAVVAVFTNIFAAALEVAAPVLIACVLTDVGFGVVSRVVPQLNVFAVGFPVKVIVGLVVVAASLPFVGNWITDQLQLSVGEALQVLRAG
ncbi:flagellar biosynthetic protein FliR [Conexibacter sp. CPCC 206217]|uniref:flagellar biosynthetic protein FliR n=1 Tax=Conexibacter sp. CPCC 206217 TaxID=3064574 RepID=UPI00271C89C9|nr:flagellar biosynthetic protein FliR [Conexibacter sp. CPCC 206217]MDO8211393.1 flagellar biosynthetic protein FliR [Conexibacter sp. CPCC 206217]